MCFDMVGRVLVSLLLISAILPASLSAQKTKIKAEAITVNGSSVTVAGRDSTTIYQAPEITGLYPTENLELTAPTIGLFIGISEYGEKAGVPSTPAHTISAAMMHQAFFDAARQSEERSRASRQGIPDVPIWRRHSDSVRAVAVNPGGTVLASGSADGSVFVEWTDGQKELKAGSAVNALAFSSDSGRLVAAVDGGAVLVWHAATWGEPLVLKHPGKVILARFSPDGSRILTQFRSEGALVAGDVWVWSADGSGEPAKIGLERSCWTDPLPAFSSAGDLLATASCESIRVWPAKAVRPSHSLAAHMPRSLSFSPDGAGILVVDGQGARLWSPQKGNVVTIAPAAKLAQFSSDGSRIATVDADGAIEIWKANPWHKETAVSFRFTDVDRLQFSPDGQSILIGSGGEAFLQELKPDKPPYVIPRPLNKDDKWQGVRDLESLRADALPARKSYVPVASAVFTSKASLASPALVVGYADGQIAIVPGIDPEWNCSARNDRLRILTDLHIPRDQPESKMLLGVLDRLEGVSGLTRLCSTPLLSLADDGAVRAGKSLRVTRDRVLKSVADAVAAARTMLNDRGFAILVIYVAAHGRIGPDGASYILPADADAKDPATWISYSQLLEPVVQFISDAPTDLRRYLGAVVLFDTCQFDREGLQPSAYRPLSPHPGLIIVESTSPGQYAWHWTLASSVKEEPADGQKAGRASKRTASGTRQVPRETDFRTRISVLPISSQYFVSQLMKKREGLKQDDEARRIWMGEWIADVPHLAEELQARIPDAAQTGQGQTVRVIADPKERDFALFQVRARQW